jgi:cell division septation protein DedD
MAYTEAGHFRFGAHVQEHLKIRLTGAIILVIVVVMLVPEMFRGRPRGDAAHGGSMGNELPLRSYTIDLRHGSAPQGGAAVSIPGPVAPAVAPAAAAEAPANIAPTAPAASPVTGAAPGTRWTVQVGSFSRRDFAERMVKQVRARGFAVVAVGPDERGLYRVRSAAVNARASAEALRQKMAAQGLKPIVSTAP